MEKLTVSEVTDLLRAEDIPHSLLTVLAGIQHTACTSLCTCMCDYYMLSQRITLMALHW